MYIASEAIEVRLHEMTKDVARSLVKSLKALKQVRDGHIEFLANETVIITPNLGKLTGRQRTNAHSVLKHRIDQMVARASAHSIHARSVRLPRLNIPA